MSSQLRNTLVCHLGNQKWQQICGIIFLNFNFLIQKIFFKMPLLQLFLIQNLLLKNYFFLPKGKGREKNILLPMGLGVDLFPT